MSRKVEKEKNENNQTMNQKPLNITMCVLGSTEFLGLDDFIMNNKYRSHSAKAKNDVSLLMITI